MRTIGLSCSGACPWFALATMLMYLDDVISWSCADLLAWPLKVLIIAAIIAVLLHLSALFCELKERTV